MVRERTPETWSIDRIVPGGDGFVRLPDGRAGFARGALPGDEIRPTEIEAKKGHLRAIAWELVRPSAQRVESVCPVARACGGCDFIELGAAAQIEAKARLLREALGRTGGFRELPDPLPIVSAGPAFHYRNRLRLHVDEAGRIGMFSRGSHELVPLSHCAVADAQVNRALAALGAFERRHPGSLQALSQIEVRASQSGEPALLVLVPRRSGEPLPAELVARLRREFSIRLEEPPFAQVNSAVNAALIARLIELVRRHAIAHFVELYAGAGNFTVPLLEAGLTGVAIEGQPAAVRALEAAARPAGAALRVLTGDVRRRFREVRERPDLVLLDPPRSGARDVLGHVVELGPPHVAFCACDPVTLARDLRVLRGSGYELTHIEGFDMFPQTHHVEALAWMTRATLTATGVRSGPVSDR